jgi:nicotinate-nucleotide--dimethylbenzimidazole phosphoribosyltransferase
MIGQTANPAASPREVESVKSSADRAARARPQREADDPAVVISMGAASAPSLEGSRAAPGADGSAAESSSTGGAPARGAGAPLRGERSGFTRAPDPSSAGAPLAPSTRARQRPAMADPESPSTGGVARPPAQAAAAMLQLPNIAAEAAPAEPLLAAKAAARPADAEGPPNRQVSSVQVELSGAAAAQTSLGAAGPTPPAKRAQRASQETPAASQLGPVERVQANARRVGEIKEMMEYMRYEQDRRGATELESPAPASRKEEER